MNPKNRLTTIVVALVTFAFVASVAAAPKPKQHHNSGHALVADKLKSDGVKQIDRKGKHTVSAEVKHGKIAGIHVKHDTKGDIAVKKYKSNKKVASLETADAGAQPADTDMGTVYIGYAYIDDDGNEEYYWFPAEEILDVDTGAVEYVPLS